MCLTVTMAAVLRPEVLERTLDSLHHYVLGPWGGPTRLVLNVDPVGAGTPAEVVAVARQWFADVVVHHPERGSLNAAMAWLYVQPKDGDVFLHCEDDVEFQRPVDLAAMLDAMARVPDLAYLQFPRRGFRDGDITSDHNLAHEWAGIGYGFHWRTGKYAMSFGPGLVRSIFAEVAGPLITPTPDPEVQFHLKNEDLMAWTSRWRYGTWAQPGDERAVRDIGKPARAAGGWEKFVSEHGTTWQKEGGA